MEGHAVVLQPGFRVIHSSWLGGPALLSVVYARTGQLGAEARQPALRARAIGQVGFAARQRLRPGGQRCRKWQAGGESGSTEAQLSGGCASSTRSTQLAFPPPRSTRLAFSKPMPASHSTPENASSSSKERIGPQKREERVSAVAADQRVSGYRSAMENRTWIYVVSMATRCRRPTKVKTGLRSMRK